MKKAFAFLAVFALLTFLALSLAFAEEEKAGKTVTTPEGLKYEVIKVGDGDPATNGKTVSVHYTGMFLDGKVFDSSKKHGKPLTFKLGAGQMIKGFDLGVKGMKVGGKRKLTLPPRLAYGEKGAGGVIPPNSTLIFEVELMSVK